MTSRDSQNGSPSARADASGDEPIYVNHCSVSLSLTTAELNFGQASAADQSVNIKSRLVTSSAYFRQIGEIIRSECQRHDEALSTPNTSTKDGEG